MWHSIIQLSSTGHLSRGRYFYREIIEHFVSSRWGPRDITWRQHLDKQKTLFWHSFRMTEKLTTADVYLAYCGDLFLSENWYKWGCDFHWRIHWVVAVTTGKTSKRTVGILRHLFQRKFLSQQRIRKYYLIRIDRKIYHCVILGIPHKSPTLRDKNYDEGNRVKREPLLRVWYWTLRPFYKVCKPLLNKPTCFHLWQLQQIKGGL